MRSSSSAAFIIMPKNVRVNCLRLSLRSSLRRDEGKIATGGHSVAAEATTALVKFLRSHLGRRESERDARI